MRHLREYEDHDLKDLIGDLKKVGQVEEWQVIFDDHGDEVPYTLETWTTKGEAEKWAEDREFEYEDEIYDPIKEDYVYKTFYKYHNPEDGQVYNGYEVRKI
tara:strand:+ start:1511 stop:1813 length:303 start_codon:yes stop_codon:yes gene_type:complete